MTLPPAIRRWLPLGVIAAGLAAALLLGLDRALTLETLARHRGELAGFVAAHGPLAVAAYVLVYGLTVALSLPGATVLTLAGGVLFGTWVGGAAAVAGATLGAVAVFLAARTAVGDGLVRRAGPKLGVWVARLEDGFRANAVGTLLFLRLVPLFPFWLVNLVPAVLGMAVGPYALATVIGIMPGALVYAAAGNGLGAVLDRGGTPDLHTLVMPEVLLPLIGLGLLALLPGGVRAWRRRRGETGP